jgi:outer membrane protein OmpA-like peptidoglycan-associated protein
VKPETINYKLTATNNNFGFNFDKNNIENIVTATSKNTKTTSFKLNGRAINKETRIPVEGALIEITTGKTGEQIKLYSDENGYFNFDLEKDINYVVFLKNKNSLTKTTSFTTKNTSVSTDFFINYEVELIELNKSITIGAIDFDCDKWDLTFQLKNELDKLIQLLNYNYSITIEIASHSDVSGDENYNKILTKKRSLAVVDYLISQGIYKNRLSFKGYGEEQILNKCISDGIPCTDIEKKQNRRIEYKILSY